MKNNIKKIHRYGESRICLPLQLMYSPRSVSAAVTERAPSTNTKVRRKEVNKQKIVRIDLKSSRKEVVNENINQKLIIRKT
jgi:uncharacterized membrane protein